MLLSSKNLEPFTLIWLDPEIKSLSTSPNFTNPRKKLRETINFLIDFHNTDECVDYITKKDAENIILIIAGRLARHIIPLIHSVQQLIAIYITCRPANVMRNQEVAKQYYKVKSVSGSTDQLIEVIIKDQIDREKNENALSLCVFNSEELLYEMSCNCFEYDSELIIWTHTFLQFIFQTERQAGGTNITELIDLLKEQYIDNEYRLNTVQEFQRTYESSSALRWMSNDTFIFRLLNRALKQRDVSTLLRFSFFIHDLYTGLIKAHKCPLKPIVYVYHGRTLSSNDFERLRRKEGSFLMTRTFFWSSQNRKKSISLINSNDTKMKSILFEIEIPKCPTVSKSFVAFTNFDKLQVDAETLFMVGTVFYFSSISYVDEDKLWTIKLILCNDQHDDIEVVLGEVANHLQENIDRFGFNGNRYNEIFYNNVYQTNQSFTTVTDVDLPEITLPSLYSSKREGSITILESLSLTIKDDNVLYVTPSMDTIASMDAAFELSLDTPENRVRWKIFILWCQTNICNNASSYWRFRTQLEKLHLNVRYFDTIDETVQEISKSTNELFFLITSDGFADALISQFHNHPRVIYLYILPEFTIEQDTSNLVANCEKIRIITDNQRAIFDQIASDLKNVVKELLQHFNEIDDNNSSNQSIINVNEEFTPISIIDSDYRPGNLFRDLSHDQSVFMGFQLLIKVIYCLELTDEDKHDMIRFCRSKCINDKNQQKQINDFNNNYTIDQSINWYTKDSFLYRFLNEAFRSEDIEHIYHFRYFIFNLQKYLSILSRQQYPLNSQVNLTVYHGKPMPYFQLKQLNKKKDFLISINTFLSTTKNRAVAEIFCGDASRRMLGIEPVIFEIKINTIVNDETIIFANIALKSDMDAEEEILFSPGAVFHIQSVDQLDDTNKTWYIQLTLTCETDLKELHAYYNKEIEMAFNIDINKQTGPIFIAKHLLRMNENEKAERFLRNLLKKYPARTFELAMVYLNLGNLYSNRREHRKAIEFFENAMNCLDGTESPLKAAILHNTGSVYTGLQNFEIALTYIQCALQIEEKILPKYDPKLAVTYHDIGFCYTNMGKYNDAFILYKKALRIIHKMRPMYHPDRALIYMRLAALYRHTGDYEIAYEFCKRVEAIYLKINASKLDMATLLNNMGTIFMCAEHPDRAIDNFKRAMELRSSVIQLNNPENSNTYLNIAEAYYQTGQLELAAENYENYLESADNYLPYKHMWKVRANNALAEVYNKLNDNIRSKINSAIAVLRKSNDNSNTILAIHLELIDLLSTTTMPYTKYYIKQLLNLCHEDRFTSEHFIVQKYMMLLNSQ